MTNIPLDFVLINQICQYTLHFVQVCVLSHPLQRRDESIQIQPRAVRELEDLQKQVAVGDHLHLLQHEVHTKAHERGLVLLQEPIEGPNVSANGGVPQGHELREAVDGAHTAAGHHAETHL